MFARKSISHHFPFLMIFFGLVRKKFDDTTLRKSIVKYSTRMVKNPIKYGILPHQTDGIVSVEVKDEPDPKSWFLSHKELLFEL